MFPNKIYGVEENFDPTNESQIHNRTMLQRKGKCYKAKS